MLVFVVSLSSSLSSSVLPLTENEEEEDEDGPASHHLTGERSAGDAEHEGVHQHTCGLLLPPPVHDPVQMITEDLQVLQGLC